MHLLWHALTGTAPGAALVSEWSDVSSLSRVYLWCTTLARVQHNFHERGARGLIYTGNTSGKAKYQTISIWDRDIITAAASFFNFGKVLHGYCSTAADDSLILNITYGSNPAGNVLYIVHHGTVPRKVPPVPNNVSNQCII